MVAVTDDVWSARRRLYALCAINALENQAYGNDEGRQKWVDIATPQADILGLEIPDPDLKWNEERGHYDFGEIDWDEFMQVINGNGPCNRQRLAQHKKAHEEGVWVREMMAAYASNTAGAASNE